ncbi:hypothetical protein ACIRS1_17115, partial [Kitasatospora sp. NPDC101176]
ELKPLPESELKPLPESELKPLPESELKPLPEPDPVPPTLVQETPAEAFLALGPQDRLLTLDSLAPGARRELAADPDFVGTLRERLLPEEFAVVAARLLVDVDPGVHRPVAARQAAHAQLERMLGNPDAAAGLLRRGVRVVVVPNDVPVTEVDGFRHLAGGAAGGAAGAFRRWHDVRGATEGRYVAVTVENLLGEDTSVGAAAGFEDGYSTATHEFAHALHAFALTDEERARVREAFLDNHMADTLSGLFDAESTAAWPDGPVHDLGGHLVGNYSSTDEHEFFAQLTNAYLGTNHGHDPDTGRPRNNGAGWVRDHLPTLLPVLERLYGERPDSGRPVPANPVRETSADDAMLRGFREFVHGVEGAGHPEEQPLGDDPDAAPEAPDHPASMADLVQQALNPVVGASAHPASRGGRPQGQGQSQGQGQEWGRGRGRGHRGNDAGPPAPTETTRGGRGGSGAGRGRGRGADVGTGNTGHPASAPSTRGRGRGGRGGGTVARGGSRPLTNQDHMARVEDRNGVAYVVKGTPGAAGHTAFPLELRPPSLDARLGEETDSLRGAFGRALDRMSRVMMGADRFGVGLSFKVTGTPHIALTVIDGVVHVAGNSGMSKEKQDSARNRLLSLDDVPNPAMNHDLGKLRAIRDGRYRRKGDDVDDAAGLDAVRRALIDPSRINWRPNERAEAGCVHGEMDLLNVVQEQMRKEFEAARKAEEERRTKEAEETAEREAESEQEPGEETEETAGESGDESSTHEDDPAAGSSSGTSRARDKGKQRAEEPRLKPWPIGGRKRDCMACHWAHAVFNEYIAKDLGFVVVTGGTHGKIFGNWAAPECLMKHEQARAALTAKITGTSVQVKGKQESLLFGTDGRITAPEGYTPPLGQHDEPYLSDSEPGEVSEESDAEGTDSEGQDTGEQREENTAGDTTTEEPAAEDTAADDTPTGQPSPAPVPTPTPVRPPTGGDVPRGGGRGGRGAPRGGGRGGRARGGTGGGGEPPVV